MQLYLLPQNASPFNPQTLKREDSKENLGTKFSNYAVRWDLIKGVS